MLACLQPSETALLRGDDVHVFDATTGLSLVRN
jgi:hypothetical protein